MSIPITTITLFRTQLGQDNVVMDAVTHQEYLDTLRPSAFVVNNCTFQRQSREMRLPISMDIAGRYNYGEFVNNGRTFYCFITDMEYVNDNMTKATYNLDYWHTYQSAISYHPVYIEREIVDKALDIFGDYTLDEPIEVNNWDMLSYWNTFSNSDGSPIEWHYLMIDNGTQSDPIQSPAPYGNRQYAGVITHNNLLAVIVQRLQNIVAENNAIDSLQGLWALPITDRATVPFPDPSTVEHTFQLPENPSGIEVRNQKSFISPFCFVGAFSTDGDFKEYDIQDIVDSTGTKRFTFTGNYSALPSPQMLVYPQYYKESINGIRAESISCENFPTPNVAASNVTVSNQISLTAKKWSFWSGIGMGVGNFLSSAGNFGAASGAPAVAGTLGNVLTNVSSSIGNVSGTYFSMQNQKKHMQKIAGVRGGGSSALWTEGTIGISICIFVPEPQQLQAIDSFFSRYGYAINEVKMPDISSRPKWNYVKTQNAEFAVPIAPVEAEKAINNMFNNGITIWHTQLDFKDYRQKNGED